MSDNNGQGDAGNISIKTIGDISLSGSNTPLKPFVTSSISSSTNGKGNAGKITIDTQNRGKFSLSDRADISSKIEKNGIGNGNDINISAREVDLRTNGFITSDNLGGKGDAGNINIKTTGDISITGSTPPQSILASISSSSEGQGTTGKITIDTQNQGKFLLNESNIFSTIGGSTAVGNGRGISISAREIDIRNGSLISSENRGGKGDTGSIDLKTTGDINISGSTPQSTELITKNPIFSFISSSTSGKGTAGKITIDTQKSGKLLLSNNVGIKNVIYENAVGNSNGIAISAREIDVRNQGIIASDNLGGKGDSGNIDIQTTGDISISGSTPNSTAPITNQSIISSETRGRGQGNAGNITINAKGDLKLTDRSVISSTNLGQGKTGDISLNIDRIILNNSAIGSLSGKATGGNIQVNTQDFLLLRNESGIFTNSLSTVNKADGGNITINSPLIIALPSNNDIAADAIGGNGGRLDITSQGLFGIKYRPKGQESIFTNDITSSSTFGQSGIVNISTPGTDPGKDITVLPTVPTDASNQIAQTCNASRENKFIIAGRGGLPPNADDPLTSDVVWQDSRATSSQPTTSNTTNDRNKLPPPAVGLAFDGKGKAFLIAAGNEGQPTKTTVACPNVVQK